jgi:hypothetical protein
MRAAGVLQPASYATETPRPATHPAAETYCAACECGVPRGVQEHGKLDEKSSDDNDGRSLGTARAAFFVRRVRCFKK